MSVTPPLTTTTSTTAHTRSRSASFGHSLPPPIPLTAARPSSSSTITSPISPSPSSALSASLKAFQELSLSPPAPGNEGKNPLDTAEFRSAFQHARRTSFGAGGTNAGGGGGAVRPIVIPDAAAAPLVGAAQDAPTPGLSTSPGSEATSGSLPTPSSSPSGSGVTSPSSVPATTTAAKQRTASSGASSGKVGKPSSTLLGVCEKDELAMERGELRLTDEDLATPPAGASTVTGGSASGSGSGIFAGGARWGWPSSSSSPSSTGPLSPPPPDSGGLQRRGSLAFASPPSTTSSTTVAASSSTSSSSGFVTRVPGTSSPGGTIGPSSPPTGDAFRMMQPLGRVVSAGAALQTPQAGAKSGGSGGGTAAGGAAGASGKEGFGLFRRFSISGLGKTRPSAPPPAPPITSPAPTLAPPVVLSSAPSPPSSTASLEKPAGAGGLQRGRSLAPGTGSAGGAKGAAGKRRISPMGEKILRGGY